MKHLTVYMPSRAHRIPLTPYAPIKEAYWSRFHNSAVVAPIGAQDTNQLSED
jgi:hypothetical protein